MLKLLEEKTFSEMGGKVNLLSGSKVKSAMAQLLA